MSSKTLVKNSAARVESEWSHEEVTELDYLATKVVNPSQGVVGKYAIINLPTDSDLNLVTRRNKVESRFPLYDDHGNELDYIFIPYPEVEYEMGIPNRPYSNMILNRWMMMDPEFIVTSQSRFLLSTEPTTNNYINCMGYLLLHTIKR